MSETRMKIVCIDTMNLKTLQEECDRNTIVFFVNDAETSSERCECMKYAYNKLIGIMPVDECTLRKIRRIMCEHGDDILQVILNLENYGEYLLNEIEECGLTRRDAYYRMIGYVDAIKKYNLVSAEACNEETFRFNMKLRNAIDIV